ncbi:hypothetical protein [Prevotella sp. KH2C16]|uniref:hypothetical protein n=1 Tax=Prevotella sp. KH2C16 TaxID=1855325 RepID=UPI0008F001A2|nr:hypothetical protein [Prevotella sp. KH2C16]SFG78188.1 hypothetical protein SAMN05216383_1492 [Prevotella sp. KH2C16]
MNKKYHKHFCLLLLVMLLTCCKPGDTTEKASSNSGYNISAIYFRGDGTSYIPIDCQSMQLAFEKYDYTDTILLDSMDISFLKEMPKSLLTSKKTEIIDNRVMLIDNDTSRIWVTLYDEVINESGYIIKVSPENIYRLKSLIGYYNYWDMEALKMENLIEKFGIPKSYKYNKNYSMKKRLIPYCKVLLTTE